MSTSNFNEQLLDLQGVIITNIVQKEEITEIFLEHKGHADRCPHCGTICGNIHDYRKQRIKDIPAFGKSIVLVLRKRRFHCHHCGKNFYQNIPWLPKYSRMTNRFSAYVISQINGTISFTDVAKSLNLSVTTVIRKFDLVDYPPPKELPRTIGIDEFKGNARGEKYQCIITDPENHVVLDILPKRYDYYVNGYFRQWTREEREKVELFVSDMWKPYQETAKWYFPNATKVVDKYHWKRQMVWAFENVRKQEQKRFRKDYRIYFKRSKQLLLKPFESLSEEEQIQILVMLDVSVNLSRSYFFKERFYQMERIRDPLKKKEELKRWLDNTEDSGIPQFKYCVGTYRRWLPEILNSMETPITNGFTEGCNNKIKVLKRNAYGYRNFKRFRNRILHMFAHQRENYQSAA